MLQSILAIPYHATMKLCEYVLCSLEHKLKLLEYGSIQYFILHSNLSVSHLHVITCMGMDGIMELCVARSLEQQLNALEQVVQKMDEPAKEIVQQGAQMLSGNDKKPGNTSKDQNS